jgi:hypothetical protein
VSVGEESGELVGVDKAEGGNVASEVVSVLVDSSIVIGLFVWVLE